MKNNKGITLIALVITIVVLIILAGVAINLSLGENGIFNKAKEAKKAQIVAKAKEKIGTEILSAQVEAVERDEQLEQTQITDIVSKYGELQENGDTIILKDNGYEISLLDIYNGTTVTSGSYSENKAKIELLETQVATLEQQLEESSKLKSNYVGERLYSSNSMTGSYSYDGEENIYVLAINKVSVNAGADPYTANAALSYTNCLELMYQDLIGDGSWCNTKIAILKLQKGSKITFSGTTSIGAYNSTYSIVYKIEIPSEDSLVVLNSSPKTGHLYSHVIDYEYDGSYGDEITIAVFGFVSTCGGGAGCKNMCGILDGIGSVIFSDNVTYDYCDMNFQIMKIKTGTKIRMVGCSPTYYDHYDMIVTLI